MVEFMRRLGLVQNSHWHKRTVVPLLSLKSLKVRFRGHTFRYRQENRPNLWVLPTLTERVAAKMTIYLVRDGTCVREK
ncbi:MAG: hypothetical protein K0R67_2776 [Paenibacillus sp.]|nr:hypothetical protein [Paenibacillus sp.]